MPVDRIAPFAPISLLVLGAVLIPTAGSLLGPHRRGWLAVALAALAVLGLFLLGEGYAASGPPVRVLLAWQGEPGLVLRTPVFEPFVWVIVLVLLAVSLAEHGLAAPSSPLDQAMLFALAAGSVGLVLAGSARTLAVALLLFDALAALFVLAAARAGPPVSGPEPRLAGRAVGRLGLGVFSSAILIALAQGQDQLATQSLSLGALFSLAIWLRLGLYPLVEGDVMAGAPLSVRLGWHAVTMSVGLYLISTGLAPWLAWPAGLTALLHGALAWLSSDREQSLFHAGYALAGGILVMGAVGNGVGVTASSVSTLTALVALGLTPPSLGRLNVQRPARLLAYLPPLFAAASLIALPFTLGWEGRGVLYRATWEAGRSGALAAVIVAEGAALSTLYSYWRRLLHSAPESPLPEPALPAPGIQAEPTRTSGGAGEASHGQVSAGKVERSAPSIWRCLGAAMACIPFLIPLLGPRLLSEVASAPAAGAASSSSPWSASIGLAGSLLWALFLGYGRSRLMRALPYPSDALVHAARLTWLMASLGNALEIAGRLVLRTRAVLEGEHYLAWALLLALGLALILLLR